MAIHIGLAADGPHINQYRRLYSETADLTLEIPVLDGGGQGVLDERGAPKVAMHFLTLSMCWDRPPWHPDGKGELRELNFVGRGKIGRGLDLLLHNLGIKISRALQYRNPDTGAPVDDSARAR